MKNLPEFRLRHNDDYIPILSAKELDAHATTFLQEFSKSQSEYSIREPQAMPIEQIIELYCGIPMDFQTFAEKDALGMTTFSNGIIKIIRDGNMVPHRVDKHTIIISSELESDEANKGRFYYTLAHEFAHVVYHRKLFETQDYSNQPSLFDEEQEKPLAVTCHRDNVENPDNSHGKNWIEWQADYFASCILMPKEAVAVFWKNFIKEPNFVFGQEPEPFLSGMSHDELREQFKKFADTFQVSKQAARIRLEKLNYIGRGLRL